MTASLLAFFPGMGIGPYELIIVGVIGLLLFGKRLPEVAKSLGKGVTEFKRGLKGIEDDVETSSRNSSSSYSRPQPLDDRAETTAPKFEPPKFEPSNTDPV